MITSLEKDLHRRLSKERMREMKKYGRVKTYARVSEFLQGDSRTAFSLMNHALAIIDDKIDFDGNNKRLDRAMAMLRRGFQGRKIEPAGKWENDIFRLGRTISNLSRQNSKDAKELFDEIIRYWNIEIRNCGRKWQILPARELNKLTRGIGKSVSLQFLHLLCPGLDKGSRELVASSYGFAIKLADNRSDLNEDFEQGYINISKARLLRSSLAPPGSIFP